VLAIVPELIMPELIGPKKKPTASLQQLKYNASKCRCPIRIRKHLHHLVLVCITAIHHRIINSLGKVTQQGLSRCVVINLTHHQGMLTDFIFDRIGVIREVYLIHSRSAIVRQQRQVSLCAKQTMRKHMYFRQ